MATVWAREHPREPVSLPELAADPSVITAGRREQILRFSLVGEEWLPDSELLTPTSKLKRRSVNARYAAEIEAMYTE
jgi:long-chain acyl-CoA synthetase